MKKNKFLAVSMAAVLSLKEGHLKHAINIPTSEIDKSIEQIRTWRDKKVVVFSDDASKTKEAVEKLTKQGFKDVTSAQSAKEYSYEFVKSTTLNSSKFQDALLDTNSNKVFLDARDKKDYDEKHAAGAKNVDSKNLDNLQSILPEDKETPIYVYCYNGNRSSVVSQKLIDLGYKKTTQVIIMNQIQIVLKKKTITQVIIMDRLQTVVTRKMTIQGISLINKMKGRGGLLPLFL